MNQHSTANNTLMPVLFTITKQVLLTVLVAEAKLENKQWREENGRTQWPARWSRTAQMLNDESDTNLALNSLKFGRSVFRSARNTSRRRRHAQEQKRVAKVSGSLTNKGLLMAEEESLLVSGDWLWESLWYRCRLREVGSRPGVTRFCASCLLLGRFPVCDTAKRPKCGTKCGAPTFNF